MRYLLLFFVACQLGFGCSSDTTVKGLVVTGGHSYDTANFIRMFESFENFEFDQLAHPFVNDIYGSDSIDPYDVLIFYDMMQEISDAQKSAFLEMLDKGKGIVFLHHCIASYQNWGEFIKILGGRYNLEPRIIGLDTLPASDFNEGQDVDVKIADPDHPITEGLSDFQIHDEVYSGVEVLSDVHPLLTTQHVGSGENIVWTNTYGNSRIVYIQFGHDNNAYVNPNFRKLLLQSMHWGANH